MSQDDAGKFDQSPDAGADELHWRETYFILFSQNQRPKTEQIADALRGADVRLKVGNLASNSDGFVESLFVESPEDHAAVEVSYEAGEPVIEQNLELAKQLQHELPANQLQFLMTADARLDIAHFERLAAGASPAKSQDSSDAWRQEFGDDDYAGELDDGPDMGMLDPTCLLTVVETLSVLTGGMAFDPAAGEMM